MEVVKITRRSVKHARLRVRQDLTVELIAPKVWATSEINCLIEKKAAWIREKQAFFRNRQISNMQPELDEVLLFGERYRVKCDPKCRGNFELDRKSRLVRLKKLKCSQSCIETWTRHYAKLFLSKRVSELSTKYGIKFGRLFIRSQLTKWGSCSSKRNISLNWRLIGTPDSVIDYVILHELIHTKVHNHSQLFWIHLRAICPWAKDAITWLNGHQPEFRSRSTAK